MSTDTAYINQPLGLGPSEGLGPLAGKAAGLSQRLLRAVEFNAATVDARDYRDLAEICDDYVTTLQAFALVHARVDDLRGRLLEMDAAFGARTCMKCSASLSNDGLGVLVDEQGEV
jgi:hypothetical protein